MAQNGKVLKPAEHSGRYFGASVLSFEGFDCRNNTGYPYRQ